MLTLKPSSLIHKVDLLLLMQRTKDYWRDQFDRAASAGTDIYRQTHLAGWRSMMGIAALIIGLTGTASLLSRPSASSSDLPVAGKARPTGSQANVQSPPTSSLPSRLPGSDPQPVKTPPAWAPTTYTPASPTRPTSSTPAALQPTGSSISTPVTTSPTPTSLTSPTSPSSTPAATTPNPVNTLTTPVLDTTKTLLGN